MKTFIITTIFSLSLISCAQEGIKGNGQIIKETRNINKNFNSVETSGAFEILINDAPQDGKIKLEGESNILDKIEVDVQNNSLVIRLKKGFNYFSTTRPVRITFNAQNLKSLGLSGSGSISANGVQKVDNFSAAISGSGDIDAKVSAQTVNAAISGSGDIHLTGNTQQFKVGISGSGDINAFGLKTQDAEISVSGSGDTKLTVNRSLTASVVGSGDIHYKGKPSKIKASAGGSGDIIDAN